jgi:hypothetical protein
MRLFWLQGWVPWLRLPQTLYSESGYGFKGRKFPFHFNSLIQAEQAHESLASIASLSVALQQLVLSKHCQW